MSDNPNWSVDWREAAAAVHWYEAPKQLLDESNPPFYRWFPDGQINACYNALDVHVADGRAEQVALIVDSPVTETQQKYTYAELLDCVARCAGAMRQRGVETGDRVLIYMPMIAEAVIGMLACARIGAVHSVVFGGFASNELAVRIDDAAPKLVLSASCGIEPNRLVAYKPLLDAAIASAQYAPTSCLIVQRPQLRAELVEGRDEEWDSALSAASLADCVPVPANHPLYILYTSGTTGQPKGVVRDTGGSVVALQWSMQNIYDMQPGEVFWAASDVGWVVGHSYIVYGPLFNGNTTLLYEGKPLGTPDAGAFWRVIEEHDVKAMFTAPTAFRAIRKVDPNGELMRRYDLSGLRALFLAGERCDPDTLAWAEQQLGVPVVDHWWQTETGWAICANCLGMGGLPVKPGSPTRAVPGYDVAVVDEAGREVEAGTIGALVIKNPLPPGTFTNLWQAEARYSAAYFERFPGYYETGDAGYIDEDGYVFVMARTDDVINVAGHRLSTGAMEEVLASHPAVAECAVIGVEDAMKGQLPLGLVVLSDGAGRSPEQVIKESIALVREQIGPVAAFKRCYVVARLPKTRSGKILRATMRSIADGRDYRVPATIDDPDILDEISAVLADEKARQL